MKESTLRTGKSVLAEVLKSIVGLRFNCSCISSKLFKLLRSGKPKLKKIPI